jgi:hypothetical protein
VDFFDEEFEAAAHNVKVLATLAARGGSEGPVLRCGEVLWAQSVLLP